LPMRIGEANFDSRITFAEGAILRPGPHYEVECDFLDPESAAAALAEHRDFELFIGQRRVADGRITDTIP
jgi:hypothetical protein